MPHLDALLHVHGGAALRAGIALFGAGDIGFFLNGKVAAGIDPVEVNVLLVGSGDAVDNAFHGDVEYDPDVFLRHRAGKSDRRAGDLLHDGVGRQLELRGAGGAGQLQLVDLAARPAPPP